MTVGDRRPIPRTLPEFGSNQIDWIGPGAAARVVGLSISEFEDTPDRAP
jgi:hypothetical protein